MNKNFFIKKVFLPFVLIVFNNTMIAQVGINNQQPNATLDISASVNDASKIDGVIAPRLTGTELKSKDNLYTSAQDGTIVYITEPLSLDQTTSRTVHVLEKGYYGFDSSQAADGQWISMFNSDPIIIDGADILNRTIIPTKTLSTSGTVETTLYSKQFTLARRSLVDLSFSVPVSNVSAANNQAPVDGTSKLFGINVLLDKTTAPTFTNQNIIRDTETFTNSGNYYVNGIYQLGDSRKFVLEAGTYTIRFIGFVYVNPNDTVGLNATFGFNGNANSDLRSVVDIIAKPLLR